MERWYVIHSQPHLEARAAHHLRNQAFEVYLPCYRRRRRHARRTEIIRAPLFPRYLFVRIDIEQQQWRSINSTIGVHHLLCDGERPLPVSDSVIASIREREDNDGVVVLAPCSLRCGETVRIVDGPFADYGGIFDTLIDEDRVALLLDLLGRRVRVQVPIAAIELSRA
jgi:transcriptional antiterminator RfaH